MSPRSEKFKTISIHDDALDTSLLTFDDMMKFNRERDFALVEGKWAQGKTPSIFHVREVPHGLFESYVDAIDSEPEKFKRAFQCGVERVSNLMQDDGVSVNWEPNTKVGAHVIMSDKEANERFRPSQRQEIGRVIYMHSFLPRTTPLSLPLPSLSVGPLAQKTYLRADASPSTVSTTNNAEQSDSTTQPVETANV